MNVVIIGAGPAGEAAAKSLRRLSQRATAGSATPEPIRITVVEKENAGGLCLNKGCVPSKTLLEHVHGLSQHGLSIDWAKIQQAKESVVTGIRSQLETSFRTLKIELVRGAAKFVDSSTIEVTSASGASRLSFDKAIIAAGTEAFFPPPLDRFRADLLDSDRMLEIRTTPKSVVVIGGGAIGCEFACLLQAAGAQVTIIELTGGLLPGEDEAIVAALTRSYEARGIGVRASTKVEDLQKNADGWRVRLSDGTTLSAEKVLVCVGRVPALAGLDLEKAGIKTERRSLILDESLRTTNPHVYAAGDVGTTKLAHAAAAQAEVAAANALGDRLTYDGRFVPRCLYSWPEVASIGRWKYELEKAGEPVKTSRAFFKGAAKALAAGEADGFVQIVSDPTNGRLLGAQIIGPHATELIHIFAVALKKEMTTAELADTMFAHPTLSEVCRDAARK